MINIASIYSVTSDKVLVIDKAIYIYIYIFRSLYYNYTVEYLSILVTVFEAHIFTSDTEAFHSHCCHSVAFILIFGQRI